MFGMNMSSELISRSGKGFWGRICVVNLSSRSIKHEDLPEDTYKRFLSGVGLGAKIMWDRMEPGCDPLGSENLLGFTTGSAY